MRRYTMCGVAWRTTLSAIHDFQEMRHSPLLQNHLSQCDQKCRKWVTNLIVSRSFSNFAPFFENHETKEYMKKILLLFSFLGGIALSASAQQLPNYGFNNWKSACASTESFGSTEGMRQRPGVEPSEWNGSSVNQKVSGVEKQQELVYNDNNAVKMVNTYVGVNLIVTKIGSVAPGFITLGTPWVYASTKVKDCNGGTYGGINFSYKPDAITGRYKRTDTTGEESHIIAYLWNGTFTSKVGSASSPSELRDNVEYAILGKTTPTTSGTLVASCDYAFTATTNQDWQTITVPLNYVSTSAPTMMNVVISGGNYWDRSSLKENTTLIADDIRFVYYSTLKTLSYDGTALSIPASNGTLDMSSVTYDASKLAYTLNGQTATATTSYNEESGLLTIVVSNVDTDIDGQSSHTYYIQFAEPVHEHGNFQFEATGASLKVICGDCGETVGTYTMVMPANLVYDGKAKVVGLEGGVEGMQNPTIVYSCGDAPINVGTYTASITLGTATATLEYTIKAKEIAGAAVGTFAAMTYTGKAQTPVAEVTLEGYGTVTGTWSQVTNVADKTTFTANGNYTGTIGNVACNMQAKEIADATVGAFAAMTYTGEAQTPAAEVTLEGFGTVTGTWSQVTNVADKTTFTANGNYTGTLRTSTGMVPKTIAVLSASIADVAYDTNGNYTFVVTDVVFDTEELTTADYTTTTQLVGENAEGATSEVLITFNMINSNYAFATNTLTTTVNLLKHEHEWSYSAEGATIYATCNDTNANCPTPTATITLQAPLDATYSGTAKRVTLAGNYPGLANLEEFITYEGDCTSVGTHTATLNYQGVVATLEFTILPKDMTDEVVVKGIADSYEFTGELIEPSITVMVGDTALVEGQDYTVAISDNLEAGVGSVVITFTGNYSGSTTITFAIIDTTIEAIMHGEHIVCYDLNGRRILEPLKGEIYIINGKKVRW